MQIEHVIDIATAIVRDNAARDANDDVVDALARALLACSSKLRWFEEREPMVQTLLEYIAPDAPSADDDFGEVSKFWRVYIRDVDERAMAVLRFPHCDDSARETAAKEAKEA